MSLYDNIFSDYNYPQWDYERSYGETVFDRLTSMSSPALPVQRYLQEHDRHLFTANHFDTHAPMLPLPSLQTGPLPYLGCDPCFNPVAQHIPSLSNSGPSSYHSSSWSDRQSTPMSTPDGSVVAQSPELAYANQFEYSFGGHQVLDDSKPSINGPHGVALHNIQNYEDVQPEQDVFDDEQAAYYAPFSQEGYQPMETDLEPSTNGIVNGDTSVHEEGRLPESPNFRRRHSASSPRSNSKIMKRTPQRKKSPPFNAKAKTNKPDPGSQPNNSNRAFPCPFAIYGCPSTFGTKNEWKRHVNTQHMRTGYWRCDQCEIQGERKPNDFNRKDLFIQHVRRMHSQENHKMAKAKGTGNGQRSPKNDPEGDEITEIARRCFKQIRTPPEESGCLFCDARFSGPNTWDERLEHIGKHMEHAKKDNEEPLDPKDWRGDEALQEWLAREGIITVAGNGLVLAEGRA